ncbi:hypothetical protein [Glaciibacter psychrotolerans]|uniref:Recombinase A n=1 Tax=Glaciibacter psychrotolerans TaxID=670054 RepID=A0A7Z0J5X2_9MICO|nr:hypothetical protein [Leifsonia psychrotolerans]NYJ19324.1 hypothetical protein [Leifsonia psychrotolerans]
MSIPAASPASAGREYAIRGTAVRESVRGIEQESGQEFVEESESESRHSRVAALQQRITGMQATTLPTKTLPTLPALSDILPGGALKQGAAYSVLGSTTLVMALLAGPSQSGSWCGVVGLPDFGAEAAARFGIDLERLVLVPDPGAHWLTVTAALVDVLPVVVTRPPLQASDSDVARLGARLRQRGCALIVVGEWPQSEAQLRIVDSRWSGLGHGHGLLSAREVTVASVTGRTGFARPRSSRLLLPDAAQQFQQAARPVTQPAGVPPAAGTRNWPRAVPVLNRAG